MRNVIEIENLSKMYDLGLVGTGTLSKDLNRFWAKLLGKPDPYAVIAEINDRSQKSITNTVLALNNINLSVKQGEVLGIIGKNGAGKSTLLKVLSQITTPTSGSIKMRGRVASLIEVGTGMHPEMTARQNIYLNGSIMGMRRFEITKKLDEIIEFAGIGKYIDTPIKRFSSGMKVRLGFAVAAFLDPEILIVDEVLAVGDAEFQKKAIGKMQDITKGEGRTVLFVSHNMSTINSLCSKCVILENGAIVEAGNTNETIEKYLASTFTNDISTSVIYDEDNCKSFQICSIKLLRDGTLSKNGIITSQQNLAFDISYRFKRNVPKCHLTIIIKNSIGEIVLFIDRRDYHKQFFNAEINTYHSRVKLPNPLLKPGKYYVSFGLSDEYLNENDHKFEIIQFEIENTESTRLSRPGQLFIPVKWEMIKAD